MMIRSTRRSPHLPNPPLLDSARADYRQLIGNAGLELEAYTEPPGWRDQQRALAEGIIAAEPEITVDMGRHYPAMARVFLADLPGLRHILASALTPGSSRGSGRRGLAAGVVFVRC